MKRFLAASLISALLITAISCNKKHEGFTINGTLKGPENALVLLNKRDEAKIVAIDSVEVKDGKFSFKNKIDMPEMFFITVKDKPGIFPFFAENGELSMTLYADSLDKSVLTGSATQDEYTAYRKQENTFYAKMDIAYRQYMQAREANDSVLMKKYESEFDTLQKQQTGFLKNYILGNGKSVVAAYLAVENAYAYPLADLKAINKSFDASIAKSVYVKQLAEREKTLMTVEPGQPAPLFTMADSTGKAVSPADFKGKVLLVDFWASWCGPCRRENPNVVAAYQKYSAKGFTVLGVSLDESREKWIDAIAKDGLTWTQVSELKGWENSAAKKYGVMAIPANFLLDQEGKIIAANLHGDELSKTLEKVFEK